MAEMNKILKNPSRKRDRQSISIPFIWEVKPGVPNKDWKPSVPQKTEDIAVPVKFIASVPFQWEEKPGKPLPKPSVPQKTEDIAVPVKFIASVPFQWEEKPGKPLPCFSLSPATPQRADIISPLSPPKYSEDDESSMVDGGGTGGDTEYSNEISESELDLDEFYSDDSLSSAPSLTANGLISTWEISNAIPVEQTIPEDNHSGELECPMSPASQAESSTSSYATGSVSLAGNSFLEWLFPLLTPTGEASFNRKVATQEKINASNSTQKRTDQLNHETKHADMKSRPLTLGELIMMSRRRSYQRKAMQRMKSNNSMDLVKEEFGCGMFGANNGIKLLQRKWKNQFLPKLL